MNRQELELLIKELGGMTPVEAYIQGKGEGYWQGWKDHKSLIEQEPEAEKQRSPAEQAAFENMARRLCGDTWKETE